MTCRWGWRLSRFPNVFTLTTSRARRLVPRAGSERSRRSRRRPRGTDPRAGAGRGESRPGALGDGEHDLPGAPPARAPSRQRTRAKPCFRPPQPRPRRDSDRRAQEVLALQGLHVSCGRCPFEPARHLRSWPDPDNDWLQLLEVLAVLELQLLAALGPRTGFVDCGDDIRRRGSRSNARDIKWRDGRLLTNDLERLPAPAPDPDTLPSCTVQHLRQLLSRLRVRVDLHGVTSAIFTPACLATCSRRRSRVSSGNRRPAAHWR